jgi:hypothetical protein
MRKQFVRSLVAVVGLAAVAWLAERALLGQIRPQAPEKTVIAGKAPAIPRTPDGRPDLQGVWSTATVTPLERPKELADKEVLTDEEAGDFAKRILAQRNTDTRGEGVRDVTSAYNDHWYDRGTKTIPTKRTSLIVDPPDGKVPSLTAEGQIRANAAIPNSGFQDSRNTASWVERGLWERCITRGLPSVMLPGAYNNNYQIVQSPGAVVILAEMIHDARVIPIGPRPHLPPDIRQWMGDSRGGWEGDTLVVDTTNFSEQSIYRGSAERLHLVERFTRADADTLTYQVTIDDPSTFTKPWTIVFPVTKSAGAVYEYACHEGNYGMFNLLSGSRSAEQAEADAAKKGSR